jgi:cyclopropane-fatty-acyl-phospholipid synthase
MREVIRLDERRTRRLGTLDLLARAAVEQRLAALQEGDLTLLDGSRRLRFGRPGHPLRATITVHDPGLYRAVAFGGTVGAAEAYADGWWSADDLVQLVRIVVRGGGAGAQLENGLARLGTLADRLSHALRPNSRSGSRRNIRDHYDLGNDFFALFLDETLTYSCGIFERPGATLAEASSAKLDRVCQKLQLGPQHHLLEIGCGWGSLALHAAGRYGCRVTATTISREQHEVAARRVREAGLEGRVEVLRADYRDLTGRYDRLASIEMIEAVGWEYYEAFFRACSERLAPDGMMLVQAITLQDQAFERRKREADFIKRHVFPGSCIPSVTALCSAATRASDMRLFHLEDIGPHYAPTLRAWRERLLERWAEARALGKEESFLRMFEYYLAYCEAAFEERYIGDAQMLFVKPACRRAALVPALRQGASPVPSAA